MIISSKWEKNKKKQKEKKTCLLMKILFLAMKKGLKGDEN